MESSGFDGNACVCGANWCEMGHMTCGRCHHARSDITNVSNPIKADFQQFQSNWKAGSLLRQLFT